MTRTSHRFAAPLAFAAAALVGAIPAQATLTVNLRFAATAGGGTFHVLTPADVGANIPIEVWVAVTDDIVVPPPNAEHNGTGVHEGLSFLAYSVLSNVSGGGMRGAIVSPVNAVPFDGAGNQAGALADLNGDGIGDLGSLANASTDAVVRPRAPAAVYDDGAGTRRAIPGGTEWLVTRFSYHVESFGSGLLGFYPVIPTWILGTVKGANWWQNADYNVGAGNGFNNRSYFAGNGVEFFDPDFPEPSTLVLAGLAFGGLLLVARRRKADR